MVGPPSEQLNCFGAMKLRIQWPAMEGPSLPARFFIRVVSRHVRRPHCLPGEFEPIGLSNEQNHRFSTGRVRAYLGWP